MERKLGTKGKTQRQHFSVRGCYSGIRIGCAELADLLSELQGLLEDYAPAWYSEDLHRRIETALRSTTTRLK
jgi:hypothetical protein